MAEVKQPKRQLISLRKRQQFMYLGLFTLVAVTVWIIGGLISSQRKTGISSELQKMAIPLNPNIDVGTIGRLESKQTFDPNELSDFPIFKIIVANNQTTQDVDEAAQPSLLLLEPSDTESAAPEATTASEVVTNQPSPTSTPNPAQLDFLPETIPVQ